MDGYLTKPIEPKTFVETIEAAAAPTKIADKHDADGRAEDVPKFYRSHSAISWNGNPIQGPEGLADLLKKMPATSHNVQSFDCHPVPSEPPHLLDAAQAKLVQTLKGHPCWSL